MSQFGRTLATAASSFASKRSYAQNIRLPAAALSSPRTTGTYSQPSSPSTAFFSALYGAHARTPTQAQVPFAGNPHLPPGISPASHPQMWAVEPPRSPNQLHMFYMQQQMPPSPSQLQFNALPIGITAAQSQNLIDYSFGIAAAQSASPAFSSSPATSCRSISPVSFDASQASYTSTATFQPPPVSSAPAPARKAKDEGKEGKKGLNPFTYYRKTFPARYPYIDAVIPTQMERSRLTGAFWQNESLEIRRQCEMAVYVDRTPAQIERLENIRLQTQEKRRQERLKAGTDKLEGRNALIFSLWQSGTTPEQFRAMIEAHDREHPLPEPARKRRRKAPVRKLDADLLLAAEKFSIASSSPQPSVSSLTQSPAVSFNPELPATVLELQDSWRPLANMISQGGSDQPEPEVITIEQEGPITLTYSQPSPGVIMPADAQMELPASALYNGFLADYGSSSYVLGSEANMDAILDAYTFCVPSQQQQHAYSQDTFTPDMDHDFKFIHALPTEEDGLAFDIAYFGSNSSALDA